MDLSRISAWLCLRGPEASYILPMYLAMAVLFKHDCVINMKHTMRFSSRACIACFSANIAAALLQACHVLLPLLFVSREIDFAWH